MVFIMSLSPVDSFLVVSAGSVDRSATLQAFAAALDTRITEREADSETLGLAVSEVFDKHPGAAVNHDALVSLVAPSMNVGIAGYSLLKERLHSYIKENSADTREAGALFSVRKGKGGGIRRWSDTPEKAEKLSA